MRARPSSARTPAVVAAAPASSANGHRRSTSDVRVQQSPGTLSSLRIVQLLRRALSTDDLLDVIYWVRQWLGLLVGVAVGLAGLSGWPPLAGFVLAALALVYSWYQNLRLDEEEYGGHQLLLMEGLMPAIGVFLVRNSPEAPEAMACNRLSWIIVYNALYVVRSL